MEENNVNQSPQRSGNRSITLLLVIVLAAALALVGWLAYQRFVGGNLLAPAPAPTASPTPEPTATSAPVEQPTITPTRVVVEATPPSPTPKPSPTPMPTPAREVAAPVVDERIRNGSFEGGFKNQQVGSGWTAFHNGSAVFEFVDETWPPAVFDGEHAQRIQVREASQPDRYAGIYQTVSAIPGSTYELTLHGQIRSGQGDIQVSQYGYRVQLGIDYQGGQDWTAIEDWVELPWDEQQFESEFLFFYDYTTPVVAQDSRLTIFIRTWNKWADPGRVVYTLDGISLIGPAPSEELAINEPLPVTGDAPPSLNHWVRILASILVLGLLIAGAAWQARRQAS